MDTQHIIGASRTTHARAVVKTVTWRGIGSFDTFVLGWLITGNAAIGGSIAVLELLTKMVLYYFHERAWSRVTWGVKPVTAEESAALAADRGAHGQDRHQEGGETRRVGVPGAV